MSIETIRLAVGTGGDTRARRLAEGAIGIVGPTGATVVLAPVFSEEEFSDVRKRLGVFPETVGSTDDTVARRHTTTRDISRALSAAGVDHRIRGAVGGRAERIVDPATLEGADRVVVVVGGGRSPAGKAFFGSVAQDVPLTSPSPVTPVRENAA